jgi:hypothetical protein
VGVELTSERIVSEPENVIVHLFEKVPGLILGETFESLLQDSTSVWVSSEFRDVGAERLGDEVRTSVEGDQSLSVSM